MQKESNFSKEIYNPYAKAHSRQTEIPSKPERDPFSSDSNMQALRKSIQEAESGKFVVKTLDELRAMEE